METNEHTYIKEVEDTMACTAFAEAGEPCPIGSEKEGEAPLKSKEDAEESVIDFVEDTMACTAFAEAGEPCPIGDKDTDTDKEKEAVH